MEEKTILALTFIRNVVADLPQAEERLLFDTPAFYAGKNIFARLKEDEENFVIYTEEREKWMQKDSNIFFITPHFLKYKYMLVNLDGVAPNDLKELLITAWKQRTSKTLLKKYLSDKAL
ncbi:MAG: MmcQ/YjbR family DNA-binding protein [Pedobacter sp.]|uniref:MmcQ/YjbR family DNA-binding protein n=1 Tax=Pedobacter sp. TaxID=1411316 RepID=UPI002808FE2E|nr:MmcQ/YjbR family DNA-binding protein [Pedobacter sp.]MDQ8003420.1 MmcQ/YjbR family DNA-binding protein [Pedobacter sp.]